MASLAPTMFVGQLVELSSEPLLMIPDSQSELLVFKKIGFFHHYFVCARLVLALTPSMPR